MMKSRLNETRNKVIKWTLIFSLIIMGIFIFMFDDKVGLGLGFIFGVSFSILNFLELEKTLIKASRMNPSKAQGYATKKYFVRYLLTGVVIFVSLKASYINIFGTILGLLLLKFVIMVTNLFNDKNYFKRIFRKEG